MKKMLIFLLLLFLSTDAMAAYVAVLETMADGDAKDSVSILDRQYLTNVLREQAVKELPAKQGFTIMTRENINAMLPPGKAIEDCEGSCLAETGKNIAADYVCQARVGRFGSKLTLSAELYETAGNKLIASFNGRGANVEELLTLIESKSTEFFHAIKDLNDPVAANPSSVLDTSSTEPALSVAEGIVDQPTSPVIQATTDVIPAKAGISLDEPREDKTKVGESIPANVDDEPSKKSGIAGKVVLSISAAATVAGVVLAVVGNNKAKDAAETKRFANEEEYNDAKDKAKSGQTLRGIGIGIAIAGAVGIGVSFAF
ncbi:hypothetical protein [Fibrobacter sp.]|uniref:hypothetical protein n=1 Tax=Fibrobacter sp. TaxID=35828 RepID=UPI0025B86227|nr:hypothetical protein [Fibrobacter sp.]MBR3072523.1 hypothetical protein [Fibrobacter sp.]